MSGLTPAEIVYGKLAWAFQSLAWSWILPLPLWLAVGLSHPQLLALFLWTPLAIALGLMLGLAAGAATRPMLPRTVDQWFFQLFQKTIFVILTLVPAAVVCAACWNFSPHVIVASLLDPAAPPFFGLSLLGVQMLLAAMLLALTSGLAEEQVQTLMACDPPPATAD